MRRMPLPGRCHPRRSPSPRRTAVLLSLAMLAGPGPPLRSDAAILYVPGSYATIQHALIVAAAGDTVLVAPGVYCENVVWPARAGLHLLSTGGSEVTTIDGMNAGPVLRVTAPLDSSTVVRGFTITRGRAEMGGGISCVSASPVIESNRFIDNTATWYGGGIYCSEGPCAPVIRSNTFTGNQVLDGSGGGICCYAEAFPTIRGNTFLQNHADAYMGGGIHCEESSSVSRPMTIAGNTFRENSAFCGGALSIMNPYAIPPAVTDNEISGNTAQFGGGVYSNWSLADLARNEITTNHAVQAGGGIFAEESHQLMVRDCVISENSSADLGGGLAYVNWCTTPEITGCTIAGNSAREGAGLYLYFYTSPTIRDCRILSNVASESGGAISCERLCSPVLDETVIRDNDAPSDGGIVFTQFCPTFSNCSIHHNGQIGVRFASAWTGHMPQIHHCDLWSHPVYGLCNDDPAVVVAAENNWWGESSGPYHPIHNPGGGGDRVSDAVSFVPWLADSIGTTSVIPGPGGIAARLECQPNPFRDFTVVSVSLPATAAPDGGRIAVYDVGGRLERVLPLPRSVDGGPLRVILPGDGARRGVLALGVHFVRLEAGAASRQVKVVRLR